MAWLLVLVCVGYLLYKLMQLYGADGDLAVLNCKMKAEYFKGRIVWVTGASSGSELIKRFNIIFFGVWVASSKNGREYEKVSTCRAAVMMNGYFTCKWTWLGVLKITANGSSHDNAHIMYTSPDIFSLIW